MPLNVRPHPRGCLLPVRARPGARSSAILGEHAGALRVQVSAPPDQGKANLAIVQLLAHTLGLKPRQVELASGPASRIKTFLIDGLTPAETLDRLLVALQDPS